MTDTDADSRTSGIEFGDLDERLEDHDYPATTAEIVEKYGDAKLELPSGETTVAEVLDPVTESSDGGDDEGDTYESAEEVRQSILTMVGDDAVGAEDYSDRGGQGANEESESF